QGKKVSALQQISLASSSGWVLSVAVPILDRTKHTPIGVVKAEESLDDDFAQTLVQKTGVDVIVCQGKQVLGTTMRTYSINQFFAQDNLCTPNVLNRIDGAQHYLTLASSVQAINQWPQSPSVVLVDIEPLYSLNA